MQIVSQNFDIKEVRTTIDKEIKSKNASGYDLKIKIIKNYWKLELQCCVFRVDVKLKTQLI